MSIDQSITLLLVLAIVLSNLPWITANRLFVFINVPDKSFIMSAAEWFLYFIIVGLVSFMLENKVMGHNAPQEWEFYAINFFMFSIFAFPGFIYRYNFKGVFKLNSK